MLLGCNGQQPQFPVLVANTPTFGSGSTTKTFTASSQHPHLELWAIAGSELRFSRNKAINSVGWNFARKGVPVVDAANNLSFTLPSGDDDFEPNEQIFFQWGADYRLRDGTDTIQRTTSEQVFRLDCTDQQVAQALKDDQTAVVRRYGGLTTTSAILGAGFVPSHGFVSINGMGVAFVQPTAIFAPSDRNTPINPTLGSPNLLFFAASSSAASLTDQVADPPYRLIGWAYGFAFESPKRPVLGCLPFEGWFLHEAGWHMANGGFVPTPPPENLNNLGTTKATRPVGSPPFGAVLWHPRIWDVHLWRSSSGVPRISINQPAATEFAPAVPGSGLSVPPGSFFAPRLPAP